MLAFDDYRVPADRLIGGVEGRWASSAGAASLTVRYLI